MIRCFLALGSNLGDREANLKAAPQLLAGRGVRVLRGASVYSTEPKEILAQPWFLNTVVEAGTDLSPDDLLAACLAVEQERGRERAEPNGPRTLDVDIIFYGDRVVRTGRVAIPHPRYTERRFVLEPLAEIAAEVIDPEKHRTVADLLSRSRDDSKVVRVGKPFV